MISEIAQKVAVIGATGQIGLPLCRALLCQGHRVVAISRGRTTVNSQPLATLEQAGARVVIHEDLRDIGALARTLEGCDVVVVALRMSVAILERYGPPVLEAARLAGVRRFVPDEFGVHTLSLDEGVGVLFDAKKTFQHRLFDSGLEWTLLFNGYIFDYFLPNLRMFDAITTFGDLDLPIATHHIDDIGAIAARVVTDPRTANRAVQLQANQISQRRALELLRSLWPGTHFPFIHYTREQILTELERAEPHRYSAKTGAENDLERWGINKAIFVLGRLSNLDDPQTLDASALYPGHRFVRPEEVLADPQFVFGGDSAA